MTSSLLIRLWGHINARRKRQLIFLLFLMIVASFAEVVSIGAVLPFLAVLASPDRVFEHPAAQPFIQFFNIASATELLLPITVAFGIAALTAGAVRLFLIWAKTRLAFATGTDISIDMYRRTLYQPYAVHVARNSSEVVSGILVKVNIVIWQVIEPALTLVSASVMLVTILAALIFMNPVIAFSVFGGFGFIYAMILLITRSKLSNSGRVIAVGSTQVMKSLQEGLGGIRDVLIDGSQDAYIDIYSDADRALRRAQGYNFFISQSPRYGMEALGMLFIAAIAYSLGQPAGGIATAIPVLGALALGAQRMLPVLQQAYAGWSGIQGVVATLEDALELLDQPLPDYLNSSSINFMPFRNEISLKQVSFRYAGESPNVLNNINLVFTKGSRVGFIGKTGSGKSTLLDIVMGLLEPTEGLLEIDGRPLGVENNRAWQSHLAHVPQAIFLADCTIEENIAFGVPEAQIDHKRVRLAASQAQIADVIESWPRQYRTLVGERGIRLSGGQRQRIGIARALYKQADVIIFDEATSALDSETEQAVMCAIEGLGDDLTILIIAHRLSTLKDCTQIVELENGSVQKLGTYEEMVSKVA